LATENTSPSPGGGTAVAKANEQVTGFYRWLGDFSAKRARNFGIVIAVVVVFSIYAIATDGGRIYLQRIFDSLNNGFVYGAVAIALVLIYKATGVINFAQGEMAMFGTFLMIDLHDYRGFPVWLAILGAMAISAAGAAAIERTLIRPFDPSNHLSITIVTLSIFFIINGLVPVLYGIDPEAVPTPFPGDKDAFFTLFGVRIRYENLGIWITVGVSVLLITLLLKRTKIGLAFRAVSSNLESSRLVGISTGRTLQFGWALAAAVGTLAACLVARFNQPIDFNFMGKVLIFSFAAATLGGLDSVLGAVVAGLLVGVAETMLGGYIEVIGSELALLVALAIIVVVLVVRPSGLFGSKKVQRV
jgi:branched-chain amino acid transport system permease protein